MSHRATVESHLSNGRILYSEEFLVSNYKKIEINFDHGLIKIVVNITVGSDKEETAVLVSSSKISKFEGNVVIALTGLSEINVFIT